MGGAVAKAVYTLNNYLPRSVNTIISLHSPHVESVALVHRSLSKFYDDVNGFWKSQFTKGTNSGIYLFFFIFCCFCVFGGISVYCSICYFCYFFFIFFTFYIYFLFFIFLYFYVIIISYPFVLYFVYLFYYFRVILIYILIFENSWKFHLLMKNLVLSNVSILSIAGGFRDKMVRSDLTSVEHVVPPTNGFTAMTTSMPGVWLPIDHQVNLLVTIVISNILYK